jgi:hypothetical protein
MRSPETTPYVEKESEPQRLGRLLADQLLSPEEAALYRQYREGAQAFGLTDEDWEQQNSERWDRWAASCDVSNKLMDIIRTLEKEGKLERIIKSIE